MERTSPPRADEWLRRLQRELGAATLRLGGFHHLSWNGRIAALSDPGLGATEVGRADWDGTLYLHERWVLQPLRRLRERWGRPQPEAVLRRYKEAVSTLLHETCHMACPADHDTAEGRGVEDQPSSAFLEEGVTELYTHDRLDDVIRAIGVDEGAPGICSVRVEPAYPDYVPGTRWLLAWVADRLRVPYPRLLETLAGQTPAGKYPELGRLMLVHTGLGAAIPPVAWWTCRRELEQAVRTGLDLAATFPIEASADTLAAMSGEAGRRAAAAVDEVLTGLRAELGLGTGPGRVAPGPGDGTTHTMEVER